MAEDSAALGRFHERKKFRPQRKTFVLEKMRLFFQEIGAKCHSRRESAIFHSGERGPDGKFPVRKGMEARRVEAVPFSISP